VLSSKEILEKEIRERRTMKPEGFKAYLFNVWRSTDPVLSCSVEAQCERTESNRRKLFMA